MIVGVIVRHAGFLFNCKAVPASQTDRSVTWKCGQCLRGVIRPEVGVRCAVCAAVVQEVKDDQPGGKT